MDDLLKALPGPWKTAALLFMVGVMAGAGGSFWRVDKFTGSEGRALADRIAKLEERQPVTYPPPEWQIWRQTITGEINDIRKDDRHLSREFAELKESVREHATVSEDWKRRIQANEQAIDNLWKWYQRSENERSQ